MDDYEILYDYENIEVVLERGAEMLDFYLMNPVIAAYDLLRVDLAPIQRIVLKDMWFKNFVIEVAGRGLGKSSCINSLCHIYNKGLVYLSEELPPIPSYLRDGDEEIINWDDSVYTANGFRAIKRLCLERNIVGKKLVTQNGFIQKGSDRHSLLTLNNNCDFVYKRLDEFEVGNVVCIQRNQNIFGTNVMPLDDAYLSGLFIGNGMISEKYNHQDITTADKEIKDFCVKYCIKNNVSYREDVGRRTDNTVNIVFKRFGWFFEKYGISRVLSYTKSVPYFIRTAIKDVQVAFLQGYFDADGSIEENGALSVSSVSKKLLYEIQLMLLNFGIVSRVRQKKTKSKFGKAYILTIFSLDAKKYKEEINFRLKRKSRLINDYFSRKIFNSNKDTIPYALQLCYKITKFYHDAYTTSKKPSFRIHINNKKELTYERLHKFLLQCNLIESKGFSLLQVKDDIDKLYNILYYNYYFDIVEYVEDWQGDCYDFEMEPLASEEPNYFCNGFINHNTFLLAVNAVLHALLYPGYRVGLIGPSFRQSKLIFAEVEKLYNKSVIFRSACEKRPVRGSDTCYVKFKSTKNTNGSFIEALPLGIDGSKIRGSRFYLIQIDELAQVPSGIIDMVLRPMAAVVLEPMKRVRELERQQALIDQGLASKEDFEYNKSNKMIMTSSGFFKFNHMWNRMKSYWRAIELEGERNTKYAVRQIPYQLSPPGFLDEENIKEAKRTMSSIEFMMEYEAMMVSDSDGFFKASLLESCTMNSDFTIQLVGQSGKKYVMGVDPNQGGSALCGIVLIELEHPNKIIYVNGLKGQSSPGIVKAIQRLVDQFNVVRIFMDSQGGGKPVRDLLEEGYDNHGPILEIDSKAPYDKKGKRILQLVNPGSQWIADANFDALSMLENHDIQFPMVPMSGAIVEEKLYEYVKLLKSQMLNIVVTQTAAGVRHFDTPKKGQNKDLYSAFVLACWGIKELARETEIEDVILHPSGLIRPHGSGLGFNTVESPAMVANVDRGLSAAVLHKH